MRNQKRPIFKGLTTLAAALCLAHGSAVLAQGTEEAKLKVSGFVSIVGGQVLDGSLDANYSGLDPINGVACPCYIADWSNGGVYNKNFSLTPESRAGVQFNYSLTDKANLVAQVVVRGTNGTPDLTWAYAGYKLSKNWEVQVGRKRIPLYYYSDFQDIGVAYPWISPPPELYGWDATNYNGGSVRYTASYGDTNVTSSLFAGREDVDKSLYWKLYDADNVKVSWKNILGGDLEISRGPLTVRGVYMSADVDTDGLEAALKAYSVAVNLDMDDWFVLSEVSKLTRESSTPGYSYDAPAASIGVGIRMGKWTPFLNYAQYVESTSDPVYVPATYRRTSATLRYDLDSSSGIKVQLDRNNDVTSNLGGTTTVFRISYDRVF
jgi:hypothetical protein